MNKFEISVGWVGDYQPNSFGSVVNVGLRKTCNPDTQLKHAKKPTLQLIERAVSIARLIPSDMNKVGIAVGWVGDNQPNDFDAMMHVGLRKSMQPNLLFLRNQQLFQ